VSRSEARHAPPSPGRRFTRFLATPRGLGIGGGALLAAAVLAAILFNLHIFSPGTAPAANPPPAAAGSQEAFTYLSQQRSNFCSLQQSTVMGYSDGMRMQGACCNPLDMAKYQQQVTGLRAFAANPDIASDPYDIPVPLAKRLLTYDSTITLTAAQQGVYDHAISMTEDKAPCCCQCWRWYMTRGLAKSLIAQRGMDAATVAQVVDLTNGCGGALGTTTTPNGLPQSASP
jgi:hypothetical protein